MEEFLFKTLCYIILVGALTWVCFRGDSNLLFKKTSQLDLSKRRKRIAKVLKSIIFVSIFYTILTFAAKSGFYVSTNGETAPQFTSFAYKNNFIESLKEYNYLISAVLTTFTSMFTYIAYLMPRTYSRDNN